MQHVRGASLAVPHILVLLASRDGSPWLRAQLESILGQQGVDLEVHIGDDASRDGTVQLLREIQLGDPRVKLLPWSKPSGSAGANFRRLFREVDADGYDFIALADQDDIWEPRKLTAAIESLGSSGAYGYSCAVRAFWEGGQELIVRQSGVTRAADFLFEGGGQGCTFVLRQSLFSEVQRFCRENSREAEALHYHDWLIYLLARVWNKKWYFDPRPWIRYRQHESNEIGSRGSVAAVIARVSKVRDGWYLRQILAAIAIGSAAGLANPAAVRIGAAIKRRKSPAGRVQLAVLLLAHGRRRLGDRIVMAASAIAGWL